MASAVIMMVAGALLNASAFTGSMVLAKSLSGDSKHTDQEKIRHDLALEKYQQAMGKYEKDRQAYQDWLTEQYTDKKIADDMLDETDQGFVLYKKAHPDNKFDMKEPQFGNYYKQSSKQKQYEMLYVGGGMLGAGYLAAKFL